MVQGNILSNIKKQATIGNNMDKPHTKKKKQVSIDQVLSGCIYKVVWKRQKLKDKKTDQELTGQGWGWGWELGDIDYREAGRNSLG